MLRDVKHSICPEPYGHYAKDLQNIQIDLILPSIFLKEEDLIKL